MCVYVHVYVCLCVSVSVCVCFSVFVCVCECMCEIGELWRDEGSGRPWVVKHGMETPRSLMFKSPQLCGAGIQCWALPALPLFLLRAPSRGMGSTKCAVFVVHTVWALNDSL